MNGKNDLFKNGSIWLKADFHLHTKADREFSYQGDDNDFCCLYVEQLKKQEVGIGIITNHNKFDKKEFVALQKKARQENIWLIPGIEFSLKEGIHLLIAFADEWIKGDDDKINKFLTAAFGVVENSDAPPYPNSTFDFKDTVELLNKFNLDYFCVAPHVDDTNGLFRVLKGRTLEQFLRDNSFKKVIAVQKSVNEINYKKLCNFSNRQIACVEGSDNASEGIKGVGSSKRTTFLKIGSHSFEAIKYALLDKENRVTPRDEPEIKNSYVKSIAFEGGLLDQVRVDFSPELNSLIGIRGSGKSSILEILRYTLGISLGEQSNDKNYKNELIKYAMKSGGKIITTVVNERQEEYRIERIYGEKEEIYQGDERQDISSIGTIFKNPVYFGQKDLSTKDTSFETDLVKKLIGNKLADIQTKINQKSSEVKNIVLELKDIQNLTEQKKEIEAKIKDSKHKLKIFNEKGIAIKLKKQSIFNAHVSLFNRTRETIIKFQNELENFYLDYKDFFAKSPFASIEKEEIFDQANITFQDASKEFQGIKNIHKNISTHQEKLQKLYEKLVDKKESLKEEFAKIKRETELPDLNPDDFLRLEDTIKNAELQLYEINKIETKKISLHRKLNDNLAKLNNLWHSEYTILNNEVQRINKYENNLTIAVTYKGRRDQFEEKLRQVCSGSGMRQPAYEAIDKHYKDFIDIYRDKEQLKEKGGLSDSIFLAVDDRIKNHLHELLTYRVPDKFTILYNQKSLDRHSLGQRATALILFLLAQKETNVLIIDQPEDDLDNQTIYEDVIKSIKNLKGNMQFIFATHNPNIPVLGDSEKVISCKYLSSKKETNTETKIETTQGTIDNPDIQKNIITIMEGGEEAFSRRKTIYENWDTMKGK